MGGRTIECCEVCDDDTIDSSICNLCWSKLNAMSHACVTLAVARWPVLFAHSIRRFCRRAEVDGLRDEICLGAHGVAMWNYAYGAREPLPRDDSSKRFRDALDRLSALALEGAER